MTDLEQLSYPIGRFTYDADPTPEKRWRWTQEIRSLPRQLGTALEGIDEETGRELLLRLRERALRRELATADLERTKELQGQLERILAAVGDLA